MGLVKLLRNGAENPGGEVKPGGAFGGRVVPLELASEVNESFEKWLSMPLIIVFMLWVITEDCKQLFSPY